MKIFNTNVDHYSEKVNFVDDNNVLVGFDMDGQCCESFGWALTRQLSMKKIPERGANGIDPYGYNFDTSFHTRECVEPNGCEETMVATFKLKKDGEKSIYLRLWNCHNGYYAHGFDMCQGETTLYQGDL